MAKVKTKNKKKKNIKDENAFGTVIAVICGLFLLMIVVWFFKKGTFSLNEPNRLELDCGESFLAGETLECDISLIIEDDTKVYSVNAVYDFDEGITYDSFGVNNAECTGEGCFELMAGDEEGFAVVNIVGTTEGMAFGKLKVNMPSDVEPNQQYRIGLKQIELSYEDDENEDEVSDEMLELEDAFVEVRAANNVATLYELSLEEAELIEVTSTDENVKKYEASVSKDVTEVTISYTLTDDNAMVSGDGVMGIVPVHYGNNGYSIIVTSEDESVTMTYEINIHRDYEFSTEVYTYNKAENYIYTGTDTGSEITTNLELLDDNLHYELRDNDTKLAVVYGTSEDLLVMNILNFSTDYEIVDDSMYVGNNLTGSDLLDAITLNNVVLKLEDNDGDEVTDLDLVVQNGYKLKIYYGTVLLDTITLEIDSCLIFYDSIIVDNQSMMLKRLPLGMTYGELRLSIETSGIVSFISNKDNSILADSDRLKTGDIVKIEMNGDEIEYTISVLGDITKDGILNIQDVGILYRYYMGKKSLSDEAILAGDVLNNGIINIQDVGVMYRYFMGTRSSLEVVG